MAQFYKSNNLRSCQKKTPTKAIAFKGGQSKEKNKNQ
jgi:hypothetical protein